MEEPYSPYITGVRAVSVFLTQSHENMFLVSAGLILFVIFNLSSILKVQAGEKSVRFGNLCGILRVAAC